MEDYSRVVNFLRNNSEYLTHNNFDGLFEAFSEAADPLGFCFGHVVDFFLIELKINILSYFSKLDRKMFTNSESPVLDFSKNTKITEIPDNCFESLSSLVSVNLPPNVTSIGFCAFQNCTHLENITIPDGVTNIDEWAFSYCGLKSITIPKSVTSIGDCAFYHRPPNFIIYTPAGSQAEQYAKEYHINFISI